MDKIDRKINKILKGFKNLDLKSEAVVINEKSNVVVILIELKKPQKRIAKDKFNFTEFQEYYQKLSEIYEVMSKFADVLSGSNCSVDETGVSFTTSLDIKKIKRWM